MKLLIELTDNERETILIMCDHFIHQADREIGNISGTKINESMARIARARARIIRIKHRLTTENEDRQIQAKRPTKGADPSPG